MLIPRVIPSLLLSGRRLVKTRRFRDPTYVGDPVNAIRIFNEKEVDELVVLDIGAARERSGPNFALLADMASECFMPLAYGGGLETVDQMARVLSLGVEKVVLNSVAARTPAIVEAAAARFGSSSVVVSMDVRRPRFKGWRVFSHGGTLDTGSDPVAYSRRMEALGAGELLVNAVDRDGTMLGFDLELVRAVSSAVSIPVVAAGGAATVAHLKSAIDAGASAVTAGSMFVFQGPHRAVLITFPPRRELEALFAQGAGVVPEAAPSTLPLMAQEGRA